MPVPTPATVGLLVNVPDRRDDRNGRIDDADRCGHPDDTGGVVRSDAADANYAAGFGAGTRDGKTRPNVLRLIVGEMAEVTRRVRHGGGAGGESR